jgi:CpeT protein
MKKLAFIAFLLVSVQLVAQRPSEEYARLCAWMTGSFNSALQAEQDTNYYDISLHMERIWTSRRDGYWLYVEQAVSAAAERPYRQRIYKVVDNNDGTYESIVYEMDDPLQYTGAWKNVSLLDNLKEDDLILRDGCSIVLRWNNEGYFEGRTNDKDCSSNLRGAAYAVSIVQIYPQLLDSWDRGFNANDEQVWGAEYGPYHFVKQR